MRIAHTVAQALQLAHSGRRFWVLKQIEREVLTALRAWTWITDSKRDGQAIALIDLNWQIQPDRSLRLAPNRPPG